jgi:hypothetical protein
VLVAPQTPLAQSGLPVQALPSGQPGHRLPPQSTAASSPFCTSSLQEMLAHSDAPGAQNRPGPQSASVLQPLPALQLFGQLPPQSAPVSSPFDTPSSQLGASGTNGGGSEQSVPTQAPASAATGVAHAPAVQICPGGQGSAAQQLSPGAQASAAGAPASGGTSGRASTSGG